MSSRGDEAQHRARQSLRVLVIGRECLDGDVIAWLKGEGLGVQTGQAERARDLLDAYLPHVVVCSEGSVESALQRQISEHGYSCRLAVMRRKGRSPVSKPPSSIPKGTRFLQSEGDVVDIAQCIEVLAREARRSTAPTVKNSSNSDGSVASVVPPKVETMPSRRQGPRAATLGAAALHLESSEPYRPSPSDLPLFHGAAAEEHTPVTVPVTEGDLFSESPPSSGGNVRLPLSSAGQHLVCARIALVDTDATRTDAIAVALRSRLADVHVCALDAGRSHFRLLRKFAPHALLIDEQVLAGVGRNFVKQLRKDPFLCHTRLLPLRFERIFRQRFGVASLESIKELLDPLGRGEADLLACLGPHVEVEFDLDQFPPHRLVKTLAGRDVPTMITCTRGKEVLRWTVARGKAGYAELHRKGRDLAERLSVDEALDWLLSHNNCRVVLSQPTDYIDSGGLDVIMMIEKQESGMWSLPLATRSPLFLFGRRAGDSLQPSTMENASPPTDRRQGEEEKVYVSPLLRPAGTVPAALAALVVGAALGMLLTGQSRNVKANTEGTKHEVVASASSLNKTDEGAEPTQVSRSAHDVKASTSNVGSSAEAALPDGIEDIRSTKEQVPRKNSLKELFFVQPVGGVQCDELVSDEARPQGPSPQMANARLRSAQNLLLTGQNDKAHRELCLSALLNPSGKGSEYLAQFSLMRRDLWTAKKWIDTVVDEHPHNLDAKILQGDILHQFGHHEQALTTWLQTLNIDSNDSKKRASVARVWMGHARSALQGGDYPQSERALRRALAFDPESAEASRLLSLVFRRLGLVDKAEAWKLRAAEMSGG